LYVIIRTDNSGVAPLQRDGILVTDTVEKADILNNQFQSAFTNETDTDIPDKGHSPHSKMQQINEPGVRVSYISLDLFSFYCMLYSFYL
jgi:hypothetical protein